MYLTRKRLLISLWTIESFFAAAFPSASKAIPLHSDIRSTSKTSMGCRFRSVSDEKKTVNQPVDDRIIFCSRFSERLKSHSSPFRHTLNEQNVNGVSFQICI